MASDAAGAILRNVIGGIAEQVVPKIGDNMSASTEKMRAETEYLKAQTERMKLENAERRARLAQGDGSR